MPYRRLRPAPRRRAVAAAAGALAAAFALAGEDGPKLPPGAVADRVVVEKSRRTMTLYRDGRALGVYAVALGRGGAGAKRREGDALTPEGDYRIAGRNSRSAYHLALRVSYPEAADLARAAAAGVSAGGDIMIHGIRNGLGWLGRWHRLADWTAGCIAVTNREIEAIWRAVPDGTTIEIRP